MEGERDAGDHEEIVDWRLEIGDSRKNARKRRNIYFAAVMTT